MNIYMFIFTSHIWMIFLFVVNQKNHTLHVIVTGSKKMIILQLKFGHIVYTNYTNIIITNRK